MGEKHYLDVMERVIYVLELSDGCFYIGQAQKKSFAEAPPESSGRHSRPPGLGNLLPEECGPSLDLHKA